jgi:Ser/Thr protein kinase RdoA (MazF antagonist)
VAGSSNEPALSPAETRVAEGLLTRAWGEPTVIRAAEVIPGRSHVVRLRLDTAPAVILKRRRDHGRRRGWQPFRAELVALDYLNAMPAPVAPRLLGADADAGILVMEDLGEEASLADSLLAGGRERVQAELIAYAQALGALHAWSMGHPGELADVRVRHAPGTAARTRWLDAIQKGEQPFLSAAAALGLATDGALDEMGQLREMLDGTRYVGLVHGDACPDNVRLIDGTCRIFDFETSGLGPVAFDAAYLLAPFPSCWCFASLPADVASPAVDAYQARLEAAGIDLGPDWEDLATAVLAGMIIARGHIITQALDEDRRWGTTTMRPRLLAWLRNFTARGGGTLPRLQALASAMGDQLSKRWPGLLIPDYPALARPGSAVAELPEGWRPTP